MNGVDRLLRRFRKGDRVRAAIDIYYAVGDLTIDEGHQGTVHAPPPWMGLGGLVFVQWDGWSEDWSTTADCIDPVEGKP